MAFESKETRSILRAMLDTIKACVEDEIDVSDLTTFDVEYMFLKIRSKSVGETSKIMIKCSNCKEANEVEINIDSVTVSEAKTESLVKLTNDIAIEMKYPTYSEMIKSEIVDEGHKTNADDLVDIISKGIGAILTEEERYDAKDLTKEEIKDFVESLTSEQFQKLNSFFEGMPQLSHDVSFNCSGCGTHNELKLQGMADFF